MPLGLRPDRPIGAEQAEALALRDLDRAQVAIERERALAVSTMTRLP